MYWDTFVYPCTCAIWALYTKKYTANFTQHINICAKFQENRDISCDRYHATRRQIGIQILKFFRVQSLSDVSAIIFALILKTCCLQYERNFVCVSNEKKVRICSVGHKKQTTTTTTTKKTEHPCQFQYKLSETNETYTNQHGLSSTSIWCFKFFLRDPSSWEGVST